VERADYDLVGVRFVEVQPTCLAKPPRPRLPESRRDGDDRRAGFVACDLELVSLAHSSLVDVSGEDEVCSGVDEAKEDVVAPRDGSFARGSPRSADQMVVENRDAKGSGFCLGETFGRPVQLRIAERAALVAKRPGRVEAHDVQPRQ
jgi:hypothetical protein